MKAKGLLISVAMTLPLLFACQKAPEDRTAQWEEMTFSATIPAVDALSFQWKAGDKISVFDGKANQEFTANEGGESVTFTGTANLKAEEYMAVTPYNASLSRRRGKVSLNIASSQGAVKDGIDPSYNYAVAYTKGKDFTFVNVPAYLKLTVKPDGEDIRSIQITSNGGEQLAGEVKVLLAETPEITCEGTGSKVLLTSDKALNGTYYLAVAPSTLSAGVTLALSDINDSRCEISVPSVDPFESGAITDIGTFSGFQWVEAVNPNPTKVPGVVIMRATFKESDFNLISDGGFEDYPDDELIYYRSSWLPAAGDAPGVRSKVSGYNSTYAYRIANDIPGQWFRQNQCLQLNRNTTYTYTVDGRLSNGNKNCYAGLQSYTGGIMYEIQGFANMWTSDEQWHSYSLEIANKDDFYGDVYIGEWGDAGCWCEVDNMRFIPKGYDAKSMDPVSASVVGQITNATFDEVDGLGKVVAWLDAEGNVKLAFSNVTINGTLHPTALATAAVLPDGIEISKFNKTSGKYDQIAPLKDGQLSIVPDAAFVRDGKTYLHYFATKAERNINDWDADYATFIVSEDNGKTWKESGNNAWRGDGVFAQAGFCNHDGYTYMMGSNSGRDSGYWANMYGARVADGKDFTNPNDYEYWNNGLDGKFWTSEGEPVGRPSLFVSVGPRAEPAVIYNPKFGCYMMIYRAQDMGGLIYRDSVGPQEDGHWYWSGEKHLTNDDETGALFAPSVLRIDDDGSIIFVASRL